MANNRIFYGVQAIGFAAESTSTFTRAYGVQSVGLDTNFNLDDVEQLGMVAVYDQPEGVPEISMTCEKVLDGNPLLYHLATKNAAAADLPGRSAVRCNVALSIFTDTQSAASGNPVSQATVSGVFVSDISYRFPLDGNYTEALTMVANNLTWTTSGYTFTGGFAATGAPLASEGVNRRQHMVIGSCRFPTVIPGISASGTNDLTAGVYGAHLGDITTGARLGRQNLLEQGRKAPYFRFIQFPVDVTTEISITSSKGSMVSATEAGTQSNGNNTTNERIFLQTTEGTKIDLGSQNRLVSVRQQGGNAGRSAGNVTNTYTFRNLSSMAVQHPQDPTTALAG